MSAVISIEEAQAHLAELIAGLQLGEELVITKDGLPVAKLIAQGRQARQPRRPGSAKGKLVILADTDDHLQDFQEYMP